MNILIALGKTILVLILPGALLFCVIKMLYDSFPESAIWRIRMSEEIKISVGLTMFNFMLWTYLLVEMGVIS